MFIIGSVACRDYVLCARCVVLKVHPSDHRMVQLSRGDRLAQFQDTSNEVLCPLFFYLSFDS